MKITTTRKPKIVLYEHPRYHETKLDRFGRCWDMPDAEICPECGQPDSCGDCNHQRLTDKEWLEMTQ